jgi:DNA invertase Pin-like site-specific DNA recombinase
VPEKPEHLLNYRSVLRFPITTDHTALLWGFLQRLTTAREVTCRNQEFRKLMTLFGYARVSTNGQTLDAQVAQLEGAGCVRIFQEKASGAKRERAQLRKLIRMLREGDVIVVTRLDRLARSTLDLLSFLALVSEKGAGFRSLAETWADTTTALGRFLVVILGGVAEFERELIRVRTAEGRARAVAMGVRLGRRPKLDEAQRLEACLRKRAQENVASIARDMQVSQSTISRLRCCEEKPRLSTGYDRTV